MTDREALLRGVATNPDEDTPRLAYADLLDELGGAANIARAQFIRIQLDLVRNPGRRWFANADRLAEAARLAGLYADAWADELPKWAADQARKLRLRADDFPRGFLDTFHFRPALFAAQGHQLLDVAPVTRIIVNDLNKSANLNTVLTAPHLLRIRSLSLPSTNGDAAASLIGSTWERLTGLEELNLSGTGLSDAGASHLIQSPGLRNLRVLIAHRSYLTERGASRLLGTLAMPKLETLDIRGAPEGYRWARSVRSRHPGKTLLV